MQDCVDIGLKIETLEDDKTLQDLVLTVHRCFMNTLSNTGVVKIIENDRGIAYTKQLGQVPEISQI